MGFPNFHQLVYGFGPRIRAFLTLTYVLGLGLFFGQLAAATEPDLFRNEAYLFLFRAMKQDE